MMTGWLQGLLGLLMFSPETDLKDLPGKKELLSGTWRGEYGSGQEVRQFIARFYPNMQVRFSETNGKKVRQALGSYQLKDNNTLVAVIALQGTGITLEGNLNKTLNFVDGMFTSPEGDSGSFYLQKIMQQPNP